MKDNIAAICLSKELEAGGRVATTEEKVQLIRFIGFGATELGQNCFPLPGKSEFQPGWKEIGRDLCRSRKPGGIRRLAACDAIIGYVEYGHAGRVGRGRKNVRGVVIEFALVDLGDSKTRGCLAYYVR